MSRMITHPAAVWRLPRFSVVLLLVAAGWLGLGSCSITTTNCQVSNCGDHNTGSNSGPIAVTTSSSKATSPTVSSSPSWQPPKNAGPAAIEGVTPLTQDGSTRDTPYATSDVLDLTAAQLAKVNGAFNGGSPYWPDTLPGSPAALASAGYTDVTLVGNAPSTVTITGLDVVKDCQAPFTGTLFYAEAQGSGDTIKLGFNLDNPVPYAQNAGDDIATYTGRFFQDHVIRLNPGETQTMAIGVFAQHHSCSFTFKMTVTGPSGTVVETIDYHGKPFEISALQKTSAYQSLYVGGVVSPGGDDRFYYENPQTFDPNAPAG